MQKPNTEYVICGAQTFTPNPKTQSIMYSMSSLGTSIWAGNFYNSNDDEAFTSLSNSFQLPILTAYVRTVPVPAFKLDGNIIVSKPFANTYKVNSFCGSEDEIMYSIEATSDGGYVAVGSTLSFGSFGEDVFMIKFDSTIYTYTSVVGLKKNSALQKPYIFYEDDLTINVVFYDAKIPDRVEIIDLEGRTIKSFFPESETLRINISDVEPNIYILRIKNNDGSFYNMKIVRR